MTEDTNKKILFQSALAEIYLLEIYGGRVAIRTGVFTVTPNHKLIKRNLGSLSPNHRNLLLWYYDRAYT